MTSHIRSIAHHYSVIDRFFEREYYYYPNSSTNSYHFSNSARADWADVVIAFLAGKVLMGLYGFVAYCAFPHGLAGFQIF
jgi:hypothetical protein